MFSHFIAQGMGPLQKALDERLRLLTNEILDQILDRTLSRSRIVMSPAARTRLSNHIIERSKEKFVFETSDFIGSHSESLVFEIDDNDLRTLDALKNPEFLAPLFVNAAKSVAKTLLQDLIKGWEVEGALQRDERDGFVKRLEVQWSEPISLLRILLTAARELALNRVKIWNDVVSDEFHFRRLVMARLHARACRITEEVITLLTNGFADGADARWRTLHEVGIVALLIAEGDEDLSRRYVHHDRVERKILADERELYGSTPLDPAARDRIEAEYRLALKLYGDNFRYQYGWAAERLGKKRPTFKDLQEAAGHSRMSVYYRFASHNVHAGSIGTFYPLGEIDSKGLILAGRSNAGLAEPGRRTASTLTGITAFVMGTPRDFDEVVELQTLVEITDATKAAFCSADGNPRRNGKLNRRQ